jgi:RNase H-fold protein (predicted Holliday junction resolvase)
MTDEVLPVAAKAAATLAESIAKETDTPIEVVRVIYDEEFTALEANAKIKQYVGVIASRRVKLRLMNH